MKLTELIHQTRPMSPQVETVLNVFATDSYLRGELTNALAPYGLTLAQFNVLRILKGHHPKRHTCSEIARRLVDRTPDVTRLVARLHDAGLVTRTDSKSDRRVVEVGITKKGLNLLSEVEGPVFEATERMTGHLSDEEMGMLSRCLELLRKDQPVE